MVKRKELGSNQIVPSLEIARDLDGEKAVVRNQVLSAPCASSGIVIGGVCIRRSVMVEGIYCRLPYRS